MPMKRIRPEVPCSLSDHAYRQPVDPRRMPEYEDAHMIHEDPRAMANLPVSEINRQFYPSKHMPKYWMESEIQPFGVPRYNESSSDRSDEPVIDAEMGDF